MDGPGASRKVPVGSRAGLNPAMEDAARACLISRSNTCRQRGLHTYRQQKNLLYYYQPSLCGQPEALVRQPASNEETYRVIIQFND